MHKAILPINSEQVYAGLPASAERIVMLSKNVQLLLAICALFDKMRRLDFGRMLGLASQPA